MEATILIRGCEVTINDADTVNLSEFTFSGGDIRTWVALDYGRVLGIVFAGNEQDALDELADSGRLDRYRVTVEDMTEYGKEEEGIARLGNANEPFDLGPMLLEEIKTPKVSFVACIMARERTCSHEGCEKANLPGWKACSIAHAAPATWRAEGKL